jgi:hypothetical protein
MTTEPNLNRWWEYDTYFGPIEIFAETKSEADALYTSLLKRLFRIEHSITLAFEQYRARTKDPAKRKRSKGVH